MHFSVGDPNEEDLLLQEKKNIIEQFKTSIATPDQEVYKLPGAEQLL